jgi:soluble lytic murein transglycosylase-like protein
MQLMPATAAWIAEKTGIPNEPYNPDINIQMGTWYDAHILSDLRIVTGSHPVVQDDLLRFALTGYNCGPGYCKVALRDLLAQGRPLDWPSFKSTLPQASVRGKKANVRECIPYAEKILPPTETS